LCAVGDETQLCRYDIRRGGVSGELGEGGALGCVMLSSGVVNLYRLKKDACFDVELFAILGVGDGV
jgi:hypothetical protein